MKFSDSASWESTALVAGAAVAAILTTGIALKVFLKRTRRRFPQKWIKVGTLSKLTIFPIKSCRGVSVPEANVTKLGLHAVGSKLVRDRVFMVVDKKGVFQVQKEFPKMATIEFGAVNSKITLKAPGMGDLVFELPNLSGENDKKCTILWEHPVRGMDCGDDVGKWISDFLGTSGLRLIYHYQNKTQRKLNDLQKQFPYTSPQDLATFQNYTSYLLVSQESVDELNTHLKEPITFHNFRPSILVSGVSEPFAEIKWGFVRIGKEAVFKASKPCERCPIVTVDQFTGTKDKSGDPLKTLTKLKPEFDDENARQLLKTRGIMGLQMGLAESTPENIIIRTGDPVYVAVL